MLKKLHLLLFVFILQSSAIFAQSSTVYFYRLKNLFMANTACIIGVNDTAKFTITNGSYYALKTNASSINLITSLNNAGLKNLNLEKGKSYYIEVDVTGPNAVSLVLRDEFSGKPAVERLQADEKSKAINTSAQKLVKVTTVAPLPQPVEGATTIYLFRPFNVTGLNLLIKISDGSTLYELKNNSSYTISSNTKEITFISANEGAHTSNTSLTLQLEKGKVYYVAVLRTGGAIILTETKEEYAKKEMKL